MMPEIIDKVDENDVVIGTTTREEAHTQGIAHRVAAIFVFNDAGELLVQKRKGDNLLDHSAAGHVDRGETYDAASARELKEELGFTSDLEKIGIFRADERLPARKSRTMHYFGLYQTKPGDDTLSKMILSEREISEMIPMTLERISNAMREAPMQFTTGFQFTLNFYINRKGLDIEKVSIQ